MSRTGPNETCHCPPIFPARLLILPLTPFTLAYFHHLQVLANPVTYSTWVFQWAFATTAATIVSGCVAERMNPTSYLIFSGFITAFFYPVVVHWVWTDDGWLANMDPPFHDFAGCAPVHMLGGISGIVGAFMIGPRTGR